MAWNTLRSDAVVFAASGHTAKARRLAHVTRTLRVQFMHDPDSPQILAFEERMYELHSRRAVRAAS